MVNLLDNARKYSPEGSTITVRLAQDEAGVRIEVQDTGMGIPAREIERIFERFYRVNKARSRAQKGTGLGLAIVKHLLELLDGHIRVESEVGVGSCFTVELPLLSPPTPERTTPKDEEEIASEVTASLVRERHLPG